MTISAEPVPVSSIGAAFNYQAGLRPDATAIVGEWGQLSYRQLQELARQQAIALRALGVRRGQVVAVWSDGSAGQTIAALLAVLLCGGAYLCLDDRYPTARMEMMLQESGTQLVIVDAVRASRLPEGTKQVSIEQLSAESAGSLTAQSTAPAPAWPGGLSATLGPLDLAYVGFTSGSTGRPRAAAITHDGVLRLAVAPRFVSIKVGDVVAGFSSMAFDASTLEIWGALLNGATIALPPRGPLGAAELTSVVRGMGVTVLWLTAGLFHQVVESGELAGCASLRQLLAGGDSVSARHVGLALSQRPGITVINGYGPTENTTFTTTFSTTEPLESDSTPIGQAIAGTGVLVLDVDLEPVAVGSAGELCASGRGLAHGYLGRGGATAAKFVPHPSPDQPGARMYRTGDRVRQLPDGSLEFLGRLDNQVKVRGFRVEIDEVGHTLGGLPGVAQSTVFRRDHGPGPVALAAAVTLNPGAKSTPALLRRQLLEQLPDYAVPSVLLVVDKLPLTVTGKLDHAKLRGKLGGRRDNLSTSYLAPEDQLEEVLSEVWAAHLNTHPVGVDDDFFEIGGHSLIAVAIIAELAARFEVEVTARAFYADPTPRGMAAAIKSAKAPQC